MEVPTHRPRTAERHSAATTFSDLIRPGRTERVTRSGGAQSIPHIPVNVNETNAAVAIGSGSQIGANSVVVKPVPPGAVVVGVPGQIVNRSQTNGTTEDARLPDPLGISLQSLLTRVTRLESAGNGQAAERVIRPPEAGVWYGEDFSI